ncbi:FtsQ-type POTRA domain-containing protein [Gordonia sp. zg691]|uniref:FtsQ-type POTRA domain-containing protein n=1 Tax=Gordonia jinghuaiqii TaxID=2758710 RepID=A0A7D7QW05_9ACTN|nr:FtsQ-type POTRA domain-containing protein [Gordonia jinghuaiqii]MBD0860092.1 FtsQ-type POTRA domain-containing protein [Gordonia jinghuaiqii]MCR5977259.1 FtsQ-type POTRA domain-containing protein [Gordonia jinghuaiqii]QMT00148.1 FtsQ-type POTRA domain-containing protein [Gordonia jinghuaiqii]
MIRWPARRRSRLVLGTVMVVAAGVGLVLIAYLTPLMSVRSTDVRDNGAVAADEIRRVAGVASGTPLLQVDTRAVAQRVAGIPSIESARVQRSYPSSLTITVVERVPVVIVNSGDKVHVLDRSGVAFLDYDRAQGVPPEVLELPVLDTPNPGPADPTTKETITAVAGLPESLARQVIRVTATSPVDIEFTLSGKRTVVWGDSDHGAEKARTLTHLLTRKATMYNVSSPEFPAYR